MAKISKGPLCLDRLKQISICSLRQWGFLEPSSRRSGTITWRKGEYEAASISLMVDTAEETVWLDYRVDANFYSYRIALEGLPSNLGKGRVWYFICPATGKRCRKLYLIGERFLSRFACPSALYSAQTQSKRLRVLNAGISLMEIGAKKENFLAQPYAKPFYNGKPTRRYQAMLDRETRVFRRLLANKLAWSL